MTKEVTWLTSLAPPTEHPASVTNQRQTHANLNIIDGRLDCYIAKLSTVYTRRVQEYVQWHP